MTFIASWHTLLEQCEELADDAVLRTPLSGRSFRITDTQEHRIVVEFDESGETRPLQRDQFETLYRRIQESATGFDIDRLPPDAESYPAVLSLHPRFEVDTDIDRIRELEEPTAPTSRLLSTADDDEVEDAERNEPDLAIYADALLLIDALERHDVDTLSSLDTSVLVNLYTLLSDVQRNANDLRSTVSDRLLDRLHHDQPVHSRFGSVQRTTRTRRDLKDDQKVLETLEAAGIDRERVMGIDRTKVDEALEVTELAESDVYDVSKTEYVRKAEVDEAQKATRLQGLKDQLAASDDPEAQALQEEIADLEGRIEDLTEFRSGQEYQSHS